MSVSVENGKYTVQLKYGRLMALRYGQTWRDCCGDNLILALASEVDRLRNLFTHERLAQLDNLVTAAQETRNATLEEGEELFTWIDTIRAAIAKAKEGK